MGTTLPLAEEAADCFALTVPDLAALLLAEERAFFATGFCTLAVALQLALLFRAGSALAFLGAVAAAPSFRLAFAAANNSANDFSIHSR